MVDFTITDVKEEYILNKLEHFTKMVVQSYILSGKQISAEDAVGYAKELVTFCEKHKKETE